MIRMFVRHSVTDFATWKQAYDDYEETRQRMGAMGHDAFRSVDDPNDVTAWHDFESMEAARAFVDSTDLKAAMEKAGVVGPPTIWFATRV